MLRNLRFEANLTLVRYNELDHKLGNFSIFFVYLFLSQQSKKPWLSRASASEIGRKGTGDLVLAGPAVRF